MRQGITGAIRAVLFDKDGTLIDFDRTWEPVMRRAALHAAGGDAELAIRLLEAGGLDTQSGRTRADSLFAAGNTREIVRLFRTLGSPHGEEPLIAELDAIFTEGADRAVALTDTPALMKQLRAFGLKLGIASSDSAASILRTADALGISGHLDFVCGYDSGHGAKPEPGMLLAFAADIGLSPDAVAMVGDNRHDMAMGRAAGAGLTIGVLSGTGTRETLSDLADLVIADIAALPPLFGR